MPPCTPLAPGSSSARILIAEDHLDSREALRILLEAFGFRVETAVHGRDALDLALAAPPDLILMDVMMPEVDGLEVIRRLRQDERTRAVPVIAVTAMDGAQRLAIQAGADDFVAKPIDTRSLLGKIQSLLDQCPRGV